MILNPDNICLECGDPKGPEAMTCSKCESGTVHQLGRPQTYTDEYIVNVIRTGECYTLDSLLEALNLKSKTTLIKRLRKMRDAGLIEMVERSRHEGFLITVKE
jgi:predicted transcriptional regulator